MPHPIPDASGSPPEGAAHPGLSPGRERRLAFGLLVLYGIALWALSTQLTIFDDEANIVFDAAGSPGEMIATILAGEDRHEHPPLYDLVLHAWMLLTGGSLWLLRVPSIVFTCIAVGFLAETAAGLWGRRLPLVALAIAWPSLAVYGIPAHWMGLTMLAIATATWSYFRALRGDRLIDYAIFAVCGAALVYTNYVGALFLGGLGCHFLATRPQRRALWRGAAAAGLVVAAAVPLWWTFQDVATGGLLLRTDPVAVALIGGFFGYLLLASNFVAPWHTPALFSFTGIGLVAIAALRTPRVRWLLGLLVLLFGASVVFSVIGSRRAGVFAPWVLLYLAGLLENTAYRRTALAGVALLFITGWIGVATHLWPASHRYSEPWPSLAVEALTDSTPGTLVVCSHPSFLLYAHKASGTPGWPQGSQASPFEHESLVYTSVRNAPGVARQHDTITWIRSKADATWPEESARFEALLDRNYRLVATDRLVRDHGAAVKTRLRGAPQPDWLITIQRYERKRR